MRFVFRVVFILCLAMMFTPSGRAAPPSTTSLNQAPYPEEEIVRRREAINSSGELNKPTTRATRGASIARPASGARAIPLTGSLQIKSGSNTTFYGKNRQELAYTIKEHFVGNLIITRPANRSGQEVAGHENYVIKTISTEINASDFKGRLCRQYKGTPPTCSQWEQLELWQIAEGEEYPGRFDHVVTASTYGQSVTLRIDGPNILFLPAHGNQGLRSGCGDQIQVRVSREEFRKWVKQGHISINRTLAKSSMGCLPGSTVNLEMRIGK
jgi:hypothetical protein